MLAACRETAAHPLEPPPAGGKTGIARPAPRPRHQDPSGLAQRNEALRLACSPMSRAPLRPRPATGVECCVSRGGLKGSRHPTAAAAAARKGSPCLPRNPPLHVHCRLQRECPRGGPRRVIGILMAPPLPSQRWQPQVEQHLRLIEAAKRGLPPSLDTMPVEGRAGLKRHSSQAVGRRSRRRRRGVSRSALLLRQQLVSGLWAPRETRRTARPEECSRAHLDPSIPKASVPLPPTPRLRQQRVGGQLLPRALHPQSAAGALDAGAAGQCAPSPPRSRPPLLPDLLRGWVDRAAQRGRLLPKKGARQERRRLQTARRRPLWQWQC